MTTPSPDLAAREALARALDELRRAELRKDEFLGRLGHELRNALTPLRIALQMLGMPNMSAERSRELRDATDRQLMRMVRMIDELMDISQIARGKLVLQREPLELAMIVDAAVEISRGAIKARGHDFQMHVATQPIRVLGDRARLVQVLGILLGNAARYTEPGGKLAIALRRDAECGEIQVRDNGCGIEAEQLPTLFQAFRRHTQGAHGAPEGLGLGLALARGLAELHGGKLLAQSEGAGKGSTFSLRVPLA